MKKILCFIAIAIIGLTYVVAQQTVTLTFTGRGQNNAYVRLDHVTIENLTRNWSETIWFPDTVYTLTVGTGVEEHLLNGGMQVMPNPFNGKTQVNVHSVKDEKAVITVVDINGRKCAEYDGIMSEGDNYFEILLTTPQTYILSVQTKDGMQRVKMVNAGRAAANRIESLGGGTHSAIISLKGTSSHEFELGDEMQYQGYSLYFDSSLTSAPVTQSQSIDEEITLVFDVPNLTNLNSCEAALILQNETGFGNRITQIYDHEGNSYQVVQIGDQCWMKENLRTTTSPSTGLTMVENPAGNSTTAERRAYYYNNHISNADNGYGLLYNWNAAMDTIDAPMIRGLRRGICPEGWHVPKKEEWGILSNYAYNHYHETWTSSGGYTCSGYGKALATDLDWQANNPSYCNLANDLTSNNSSGFSALPAGYNNGSTFYSKYFTSEFWTSSVGFNNTNTVTGYHYSSLSYSGLSTPTSGSYYGEPVRCVRDGETYLLHFNANGGSGVMEDEIFLVGVADYIAECRFTRNQYECNGWNTQPDGSGTAYTLDEYIELSADMTLYAQWGAAYTLTFDANGGTGGMNPQIFVEGLSNPQTISPNVFNKALFLFDHWNTNAAGTGISYGNGDSITLTQDMTLYAQWRAATTDAEKDLTSCTVVAVQANEIQNGSRITAVKDHQNNSYQVVQIGSQCWLKENMRATTSPSTGSNIVELPYSTYTYSGKKAYYYHDDTTSAGNGYGLYYNWNAALDTFNTAYGELSSSQDPSTYVNLCVDGYRRGICPEGWHVPSYGEYNQLIYYVAIELDMDRNQIGSFDVAEVLSAPVDWDYYSTSSMITNATGFSWLPTSDPRGSWGSFWTSTQGITNNQSNSCAWIAYNNFSYGSAWYGYFHGSQPVRCVRDYSIVQNPNDGQPCVDATTVIDYDSNVYNTVQIGSQCWLKENLRSTHYADGSPILNVDTIPYDYSSWETSYSKSGYYHRSPNFSEDTIGLSYLWNTAIRSSGVPNSNVPIQGVCPQGWHLPNVSEWQQLDSYLRRQCAYTNNGYLDLTSTDFAAVLTPSYHYNSENTSSLNTCFWASNMVSGRCYYYGDELLYFTKGAISNQFNYVRCIQGDGIDLAMVATAPVDSVDYTSAICGGNVLSDGGATVTSRGLCWSTSPNPTVADSNVILGTGTGSFTSHLTGLTANTLYYIRAFATNAAGTAYGDELTFVTTSGVPCPGAATVTDIEGNVYNTVQIGEQCWMKENLRTRHYANGSAIPLAAGSVSSTMAAYCFYPNDDSTRVDMYGLLYNWKAVMENSNSSNSNPSGIQGVCPTGWHVPSESEWSQLLSYVSSQSEYICGGDSTQIAKALASKYGWGNYTCDSEQYSCCEVRENSNLNNATGFSALPARSTSSNYYGGNFWSCTENSSYYSYPYSIQLRNYYSYVSVEISSKGYGFSLRCLRDNGAPHVSTTPVNNIIDTSALSGGIVVSEGLSAVTARGVCWSTHPHPTIADSHTNDGVGAGSFTSTLSNLTDHTIYYVRAYAINNEGVGYGEELSFTTLGLYAVSTGVSNPTQTSAILTGEIVNPLNTPIVSKGFDWKLTDGGAYTTVTVTGDTLTYALSGLTSNTSYTYRAFVTTSTETRYSEEWEFYTIPEGDALPCPGTPTVTDIDGNVYNTVQIGNQCWMKENLRTARYSDGTSIPLGSDSSTTTGYRYDYTNSAIPFEQRGYLYNWKAVMRNSISSETNPSGVQGICPTGWHVPSDAEWAQLTDYVGSQNAYRCGGSSYYIAKALASNTGWNTSPYSESCTVGDIQGTNNATGFSALPTGYYYGYYNSHNGSGGSAYFWSSTTWAPYAYVWYRMLGYNGDSVDRNSFYMFNGYSVRCLRD